MKLFRGVSPSSDCGATSASFAVASCGVGDRRSGTSVHQRFKNVRVVGVFAVFRVIFCMGTDLNGP